MSNENSILSTMLFFGPHQSNDHSDRFQHESDFVCKHRLSLISDDRAYGIPQIPMPLIIDQTEFCIYFFMLSPKFFPAKENKKQPTRFPQKK
jgi:hypothetical protein